MNTDSKLEIVQNNPGAVITRERPLLFAAVYFIGVVIVTVNLTTGSGGDFLFILTTFVMTLFLLPYGLLVAVDAFLSIRVLEAGPYPGPVNVFGAILLILSYLSNVVIPWAGSRTKKQQTFGLLFLAFTGLILANVAGCSLMW